MSAVSFNADVLCSLDALVTSLQKSQKENNPSPSLKVLREMASKDFFSKEQKSKLEEIRTQFASHVPIAAACQGARARIQDVFRGTFPDSSLVEAFSKSDFEPSLEGRNPDLCVTNSMRRDKLFGLTLLGEACHNGNIARIRFLIENNADVNAGFRSSNRSVIPPLFAAAISPHLTKEKKIEVMQILIQAGANPLLQGTIEGGSFWWIAYLSQISDDPLIMQFLLDSVTDQSQPSRTNADGTTTTLLDSYFDICNGMNPNCSSANIKRLSNAAQLLIFHGIDLSDGRRDNFNNSLRSTVPNQVRELGQKIDAARRKYLLNQTALQDASEKMAGGGMIPPLVRVTLDYSSLSKRSSEETFKLTCSWV